MMTLDHVHLDFLGGKKIAKMSTMRAHELPMLAKKMMETA